MGAVSDWVVVDDFSPGIRQVVSVNHPPGSAQADGTFRCWSRDGGSLAPLPRIVKTIPPPLGNLPAASSLKNPEFKIAGIHAVGPVFWPSKQKRGASQDNTELYLAVHYWMADGAKDRQWYRVYRYRENWVSPEYQEIWSGSDTFERYNPYHIPPVCDFVTTRCNPVDVNQAGPVVVAFCFYGNIRMFPNPSNPSLTGTRWVVGDNKDDPNTKGLVSGVLMVGHQGRLVIFPLSVTWFGNQAWWVTNEQMYWTKVNDHTQLSPLLNNKYYWVHAGFEDASGFQSVASLTADELVMIKSSGGAVVLRGDLDDFTAVNYPYVRSTGYTINRGVKTPVGFAYPVDASGIWVWSGGQVSENVSKHLDDDFWRPPRVDSQGRPIQYLFHPSSCASWGEQVLFPNNWLWDLEEGGWWRIEDPDVMVAHRWVVDWRGRRAYASTSGFVDATDPAFWVFDRTSPARSFEWHSHPLSFSNDRMTELREMVLVASGTGTVRVLAYTAEDPLGEERVFEVGGTPSRPVVSRQPFSVRGTMLTLKIRSEGAIDAEVAAPTVHQVRLGVTQSALIGR